LRSQRNIRYWIPKVTAVWSARHGSTDHCHWPEELWLRMGKESKPDLWRWTEIFWWFRVLQFIWTGKWMKEELLINRLICYRYYREAWKNKER
jgi:Aspartyl aminopeptidase